MVSCICTLPRLTSSIARTTRLAAELACSAFCFVFSAISSMEAVICWMALACSVEPWARAWLALATWEELMVTWAPASLILVSALWLSSTSFFKEWPRMSSAELGLTVMVRFPPATSSATWAWYLMFSITLVYSSTSSPNSSLLYLTSLMSTRPFAISFAASDSCTTDFSMTLISASATNTVIPTDTTATTAVKIAAFVTYLSCAAGSVIPTAALVDKSPMMMFSSVSAIGIKNPMSNFVFIFKFFISFSPLTLPQLFLIGPHPRGHRHTAASPDPTEASLNSRPFRCRRHICYGPCLLCRL